MLTTTTVLLALAGAGAAATDWHEFTGGNGCQYKHVAAPTSWFHAVRGCHDAQGVAELATVLSVAEAEFVAGVAGAVSRRRWVYGFSDEGEWNVDFAGAHLWKDQQPGDYQTAIKHCVYQTDGHLLAAETCSVRMPYVCKRCPTIAAASHVVAHRQHVQALAAEPVEPRAAAPATGAEPPVSAAAPPAQEQARDQSQEQVPEATDPVDDVRREEPQGVALAVAAPAADEGGARHLRDAPATTTSSTTPAPNTSRRRRRRGPNADLTGEDGTSTTTTTEAPAQRAGAGNLEAVDATSTTTTTDAPAQRAGAGNLEAADGTTTTTTTAAPAQRAGAGNLEAASTTTTTTAEPDEPDERAGTGALVADSPGMDAAGVPEDAAGTPAVRAGGVAAVGSDVGVEAEAGAPVSVGAPVATIAAASAGAVVAAALLLAVAHRARSTADAGQPGGGAADANAVVAAAGAEAVDAIELEWDDSAC